MELLRVREAAERLGVHENTLRRWAKEGRVPSVKLPSGINRFRVADIDQIQDVMQGGTRAFSLVRREGTTAIDNACRLASGQVSLSQLNDDRYGVGPDGKLRLVIDDESFAVLAGDRAA